MDVSEAVRRATRDAVGVEPTAVEPFDRGTNHVARVTVPRDTLGGDAGHESRADDADATTATRGTDTTADDETALVVKLGTETPAGVRSEGHVIRVVGGRTTVPVPTLRARGTVEETPYLLLDRAAGEVHPLPTLEDADAERLARELGGHLAALHAMQAPGWGAIRGTDDGLATAHEFETWPALAEAVFERNRTRLSDTRFADLAAPAADAWPRLRARLSSDRTPVVTHNDPNPGNLALAPDADRLVQAVLDWNGSLGATPDHELALVELLALDSPAVSRAERQSLREALVEAYERAGGVVDRSATGRRRREVSRVIARLRSLRHVGLVDERFRTASDLAPAACDRRVDAWAARHRDALARHGIESGD